MTSENASDDRDHDVVVYGASGFTGRLVAEYLNERYPPRAGLRWAAAGRDAVKVRRVLAQSGIDASRMPIIEADSGDPASLDALAASTRVVLTTVGPYAKYGGPLVEACVRHGTDYCDLAGEVQWMRRMIDRYQTDAEQSGARIVHACGFDSIPSDLGVWFLQRQALEEFGEPCRDVSLYVRAMRGGASGGTAASMLNAIEEAQADRSVARVLADPYSLNPEGLRDGPDDRDQRGAVFDDKIEAWTAPFVMAMINTRVVRRTNALLGFPYGKDFRYREATYAGPGAVGWCKAASITAGLAAFMAASSSELTREHLVRRLVPDPGEGPTRQQRENGFFNLILVGETAKGKRLRVRVKGDRDPGYGATSRMLGESAVCLATDELAGEGGFWTPASLMGDRLLDRLQQSAGMSFTID